MDSNPGIVLDWWFFAFFFRGIHHHLNIHHLGECFWRSRRWPPAGVLSISSRAGVWMPRAVNLCCAHVRPVGDLHCYFIRGYNSVHVVESVMNGIVRCLCTAWINYNQIASDVYICIWYYGLWWIVWAGVSKKNIWNRGRWWNCTFCLTFSCCRNLYSTSKSEVYLGLDQTL